VEWENSHHVFSYWHPRYKFVIRLADRSPFPSGVWGLR